MPLSAFAFEAIDRSHLEQLDVNNIPESHRLDFKRDAYPPGESGSKEFLKDISAFANHSGGHLVIGIDEKAGPGKRLVGISVEADKEIARLENIARTGLDPRITGLRIKTVEVNSGKVALIIRIPKSWNPPHRVIVGNSNRFHIRNSNGAHEMSLQELRAAFGLANSVSENIATFRNERVNAIANGRSTFPLYGVSCLVFHIIPFSAFTSADRIEMSQFETQDSQLAFLALAGTGFDSVFNLDGLATVANTSEPGVYAAYTQLYRSGIIEAGIGDYVRTNMNGDQIFHLPGAEELLEAAVSRYVPKLREIGIDGPVAIAASAVNVAGAKYDPPYSAYRGRKTDRPNLLLPEVTLDSTVLDGDWRERLRPAANALWNAFGYAKSHSFDKRPAGR